MPEHRGVNYGFAFGRGEPIYTFPISFGFDPSVKYVPPAIPETNAEPPDDLVVLCKNCGAEIELCGTYDGYEWWHKDPNGGWLTYQICKPNTIIVEEKNDESSRTDPGSRGQEEGAPEPGTGGGERGPRSIPALLPEVGDR